METDSYECATKSDVIFCRDKLIIEILKDISDKQSNISDPLKGKLKKLLADADLSLYMSLHKLNVSDHRSSNIFGLAPIKIDELSFSEQKTLQIEVEKYILNQYPKSLYAYNEITNGSPKHIIDKHNSITNNEQYKLVELSKKYISILCDSMKHHKELCDLMNEWIEMRTQNVMDRTETTVQLFEIKNKILELKAKIIEVQLSLTIYNQSNNSVLAYMEINKDITNRIDEYRNEIFLYKKTIEDGL